MNYSDAVRAIAADFKRRKSEYEQAELHLLSSNAEFAESEREKRALLLAAAKGEKPDSDKLEKALAKNEAVRKKLGLVPPKPRCPVCSDTGRANGKFCDCAVALAVRSQSGELGIPLHSFEETDFSVYGDEAENYIKLFSQIKTICSSYPQNKKRCIVLCGGTGNGKTYLAGCAAKKLLERGLSVMALTAFAANDRFLKYHTCFDGGKAEALEPLLHCSALIIDDLGTESILKNVTLEYLYQVINERNTSGKLTFITTNLTPEKLLSRYGERIYSRLFDKSLSFATYLKAKDIRKAF